MLKLPVYLDNNATTSVDPEVLEAMLPYFTTYFGNAASRNHSYGWEANEAVNYAREQVAQLVGAEPKEIIFTSGATESDNLALKGVFEMYAGKGDHIITVATEHKAVLDSCAHIEKLGGDVTYLGVNSDGLLDLQELEAAIKPTTILVSVMFANNETGTIQPVKQISDIARKHGVLFFTDATQAAGKIPVDVTNEGIDLMAFSAHKMHGPKGAGALYVRRRNPRVNLAAQIDGGGHERALRSGTLNVPGIVGFGKACEIARLKIDEFAKHMSALRDKLETALLQLPATGSNGSKEHRLPNVSNIWFNDVEAENMIIQLGKNIAISSGSACSSASIEPSHVLKAMGLSDELAYSSLRFSLSRFTTEEEVDYTIDMVSKQVMSIRDMSEITG